LCRPVGADGGWGAVKSVVVGALSFGVVPLLTWPARLGSFITAERAELWHLAEWVRLRTGRAEAVELQRSAERLGVRARLSGLALLTVLAVAATFFAYFNDYSFSFHRLIRVTYVAGWPRHADAAWRAEGKLWMVWTVGLSLAYLAHYVQVRRHARAVEAFVRQFNRIGEGEGLSAARLPELGLGIRPLWVAGAIVLVGVGAVWGVPMMLAGAVHRRYTRVVSRAYREELARRVRSMLAMQRPEVAVPVPVKLRRECPTDRCRAKLKEGANFCHRCGARVAAVLDRVA